ncbi:MAG: hypothetical protein ACPG47_00960 [Leucothrix sp.]
MGNQILLLLSVCIISASTYAASLQTVPMPSTELNAIAGHYSSAYGYVHVKPNQHSVFTDFNGRRITGIKKSDGYYYSTFKLIGFIPISLRMSLDKVNGLHRVSLNEPSNKKIVGQQFRPTPISPYWQNRLGKYRVTTISGNARITRAQITAQDGILLIRLNNGKYAYPLVAQKPNKLVRPTIGRPQQRQMALWPEGNALAAIIGNTRLRLDKI